MRALVLLLLAIAGLAAGEPLADQATAAALAFAEAQNAGHPGQITFKVLQPPVVPHLRGGTVVVEPSHLSKQEPTGRFFVGLRVLVDGRLAATMRVDLEGRWFGDVLKARTSLARRQPLTEDLVEKMPLEGQPPAGVLVELPEGMRVRAAVTAGKVLTRSDLEPIPLINPGDKVRLIATSGDLTIQAEALARSGGIVGDRIRLEMPSRRQVTAEISGPGEALMRFAK